MELTLGLILLFTATAGLVRGVLTAPVVAPAETHRLRQWRDSAAGNAATFESEGSGAGTFYERVVRPALRQLGSVVHRSAEETSRIQEILTRAGYEERITPIDVFALQMVFVLVALAASAMFFTAPSTRGLGFMILLFGGLLGWRMPVANLENRARRRQVAFQKALPDLIDLLATSVEAGLSFDAAIGRVAEEFGGVVREEIDTMLSGMKVGRSRAEALRLLDRHIGSQDVKTFVSAIIQAETLGASLGNVLKVQAAAVRLKRRQAAQERAAKTPVKLLIPMVFLIMPTIFMVLLTPAAIHILQAFRGGH